MQFKKKLIPALVFSAVVSGGLVAGISNVYADDSDELAKLRAQIEELDQKIKILDRKSEIAAEESAAKKKETPIVSASKDGFGFKSADGNFDIRFKALLQLDYRSFYDHGNTPLNVSGFDFRRIRPTIDGTLWGKYDFRFTPEFGEDKTTVDSGIVDAYVDARFTPYFQVKAGKFKPFLGLERLQSGSDLKFIERSYVSNNIEPNRDVGASIHGDILDGKVNYAVGVFNGVVDGGDNKTLQDTSTDKDYAARIFVTPFKDTDSVFAGLGVGLSASHGNFLGNTTNTGLPSYKTPGQQQNFFTYTNTIGNGDHDRISPQGYFYYGPFGVIAEYAQVSQDVQLTTGTKLKGSLDNSAWQIAGSWLLTGEDASFKGVKPKQVFDADGGGWGAWELVARYEQNDIDSGAFTTPTQVRFASPVTNSKTASSWAAGVNWYLNQNVRLEANYEQTSFDLGGGGTIAHPIDRPDEKILFTRLQLSY